jgi:hypothetical protein
MTGPMLVVKFHHHQGQPTRSVGVALRSAEMEVTAMPRSKPAGPPTDQAIQKISALQKDSVMIVYQEHPWNNRPNHKMSNRSGIVRAI